MSAAHEFGNVVLGAGVSYLLKGGYRPFSDFDETYDPGDEVLLTVGASSGRFTAAGIG